MEHYALTVLKMEKSRLEYVLFEMEKFNESVEPYKKLYENGENVYIAPFMVNRVREKLKEINEAIEWLEGKK